MLSKKWLLLIIFVILLAVLTDYLTYNDKDRKFVEEYIFNSEEIKQSVGEVASLKLTEIRKVGLDSKEFRYKKYFYRVFGETGQEDIIIKLTILDKDVDGYEFELVR
jgi:2-iminoacetate synthase ThiH